MNRHPFLLFFVFLFAFNQVKASSLQALFTYMAYTTPDNKSYVETYLSFQGSSLEYVPVADKFQASVEVTMIISRNDSVFFGDKYVVSSPKVDEIENVGQNFLDKQRIPLLSGTYDLELIFKDVNSEIPPITSNSKIEIVYNDNNPAMADIMIVDSYKTTNEVNLLSKSGYDLIPSIPYGNYFFGENDTNLQFYTELYHLDKAIGENTAYLLSCSIVSNETGQVVGSYRSLNKHEAAPVQVVFTGFDISKLSSGNYKLQIEARDRENAILLSRSLFFQRSNPDMDVTVSVDMLENSFVGKVTSLEEMEDLIACIIPICDNLESIYADNQLKGGDLELMKRFFFNFWRKRNELNPQEAWSAYKQKVDAVNNEFSTFALKGYRSDRGRVYLQYGSPDQIEKSEWENRAYPYQIWQYYRLADGQSNKIFIFAERAVGTNDYELIHSNTQGEIYNPKWRRVLDRNHTMGRDIDNTDDVSRENLGEGINRNSILNNGTRSLRTTDPNR